MLKYADYVGEKNPDCLYTCAVAINILSKSNKNFYNLHILTLESGTVEINLAILGIDLFVYYVYI
jgi:hypothetical protein